MSHRGQGVILAAMLAGAIGCKADPGELASDERRPYGPAPVTGPRTIEVRNACPEAVVIAVSPSEPVATTPTMQLGSTKVEVLTVEQGARIWLRNSDRFSRDLSVAPVASVEIAYQCNRIYERGGGR